MNRRTLMLGLLVLLVATPSFAWLGDYRFQASLTGAGNVTLAILDTQTLISNSKMEGDCADIRVTDTSDNEYEYYVERCNTTTTRVYARPTNETETAHFIYYGYVSATDTSDFNATFSNEFIPNGDFEADTIGNAPASWSIVEDASTTVEVSSTQAFWGTQATELVDNSGSGQPELKDTFTAISDETMWEFDIYVASQTGDGIFMHLGDASAEYNVQSLYLLANTTLAAYPANTVAYTNCTVSLGSWALISATTDFATDTQDLWVDGAYCGNVALREAAGEADNVNGLKYDHGTAATGTYYIDAVRMFRFTDYVTLGTEVGKGNLSFSFTPLEPLVNDTITFVANWTTVNITQMWWNFSATNQTFYTTDTTTEFDGYSTAGTKNVTLIGYDGTLLTNDSYSENVVVYDNLAGAVVEISSYLPFIANEPTITINYGTTGGPPTLNSSWTITLPDATTNTSVENQSSFTYALVQSDVHTASVTVCDVANSVCITNSSQFKAWNVTSTTHLHTPFNATSDMLAEAFYGDSVSFTSTGVLNWGLGGELKEGTTTTWTLDTSNGFWSNEDYVHYRFTVNNSWGDYVSNQSFTAVAALYNISVGCIPYRIPYCFLLAEIFDIETGSQITDTGNTYDYFLDTIDGYGHTNQTANNYTGSTLNLSLCLNATPKISELILDGTFGYSAVNYTDSSYAFDAAGMDFVTSCTYANGHRYKFYVQPNTTTTYDTTLIIKQGGTALQDALVKLQSVVDGNWVVLSSGITDVNGKVSFPMRQCYEYYKIIVEDAGEVLHESEVTCLKASECTTTTCERIIEIETVVQEWYSVQDGIAGVCEYNSGEDYFKCTITDTSGKGVSSELNIYRIDGVTPLCTESETSTTTTLICSTSGAAWMSGPYKFQLDITTSSDTYVLQSGGFTIGEETTLGTEGPIVALAVLLTLIFAVAKTNPIVLVSVSTLTFILLGVLKLTPLSYTTTGWLVAMGLIAIARGMTK